GGSLGDLLVYSCFMHRSDGRRRILASILLVGCLMWADSAEAAWPRLLMAYGSPLTKPIVIDDALGIVQIFEGSHDINAPLSDRPYLNLALLWGLDWNRYVDEGKALDQLRPEDAKNLSGPSDGVPIAGRLYPACGDLPAVIHLTANGPIGERNIIWHVSASGL